MMFFQTKLSRTSNAQKRSGSAVAEFAFISPILALVIMGMIELSRGLMVKVTLSDAARASCRGGIHRGKANADIVQYCTDVMRYNYFDSSKFNPNTIGSVTINVTDGNGNTVNGNESLDAPPGSYVSVQVSIPVSSTTWVPSVFLSQGSLESETVVMMKQ
jgi:Flp pilus assembly protein TadG